jgi:S-adenosylmethionine hydrolase
MASRPLITLLTDFGLRDTYVAEMKGVILGINPGAVLVDLCHEVPPQDIVEGAWLLAQAAPAFPYGTIHLAVVDPGVGTGRRALAAAAGGQFWVGPDNGIFHLVFSRHPEARVVSLENPRFFREQISPTFHGRDIFAPVAAHLSRGTPLEGFGPPITDPVPLPLPEPRWEPHQVQGEIVRVDHFGNLVSNIPGDRLRAWLEGRTPRTAVGSLIITGLVETYGHLPPGEFAALVGSHGRLEIARVQGHAAHSLQCGPGTPVTVMKT